MDAAGTVVGDIPSVDAKRLLVRERVVAEILESVRHLCFFVCRHVRRGLFRCCLECSCVSHQSTRHLLSLV